MAKDFDFKQIGKRLPYTVPEGFFDDFEKDVAMRASMEHGMTKRQQKRPWMRKAIRPVAAAATVAAIIIALNYGNNSPATLDLSLEQAFANLSETDQEFLLETYQDVSFISEQL